LNIIANEVKKTMDFYTSKHNGEVVKVVTLAGGAALLPEIINELSGMLGVEVVVANPFTKVKLDPAQDKQMVNNGPLFSVAVGLAMREI
jgi:type IV pilus assembly protein PilM